MEQGFAFIYSHSFLFSFLIIYLFYDKSKKISSGTTWKVSHHTLAFILLSHGVTYNIVFLLNW